MKTAEQFISHANNMADHLPAKTMIVFCRGEEIAFESSLSDDAAIDGLRHVPGKFAASLWEASYEKPLSQKQLVWAHKLVLDWLKSQSMKTIEFDSLFAAFEAAKAKGAKRLTLRFDGFNVKPNRELTALWITSSTEKEEGEFGLQPKYLGKITRSGMDSRIPGEVKERIELISKDPLTAAVKYGKTTGECSCCGRELTNAESIRLGIGPVCREKFGW